ncbi:hypothetical protein [Paenibacillus planticolens]|uniref:Uncharacterized protein n=1 Tax=Paenibacillus planticolens TaxID=2654976 RepID=A0ABX1ZGD6_9BACL|nr:hypothetical protein [Paenibacillus planticolens]NOU98447.1 hypothetical protein [Paenibacillus planticolens]
MDKFLWSFHWDCGRSGDLEGLFVATEAEVSELAGKSAWFGEVLGKHSEVYGTLKEEYFSKVDLDVETVLKVAAVLGRTWSGFDPRYYISEE